MSTLPYDPHDPPDEPPPGVTDPLLWAMTVRLFRDHQPSIDGWCQTCRQFYPCPGRRLADTGFASAIRYPFPPSNSASLVMHPDGDPVLSGGSAA